MDMDMWNWLSECYEDESLTIEHMEKALENQNQAYTLFEEFVDSNRMAITEYAQETINDFLEYVKKEK
jgi:hypothetical protein